MNKEHLKVAEGIIDKHFGSYCSCRDQLECDYCQAKKSVAQSLSDLEEKTERKTAEGCIGIIKKNLEMTSDCYGLVNAIKSEYLNQARKGGD